MKRFLTSFVLVGALGACLLPSAAVAQTPLVIATLAEKRVTELPPGQLFWRTESLTTYEHAQAAAGTWVLIAESAGKVWLFTLGPAGRSSEGCTKVVEVGPVPRYAAPQYVLAQSVRIPHGVMLVKAGEAQPGHGAGIPMQISAGGTTDLHALVMFVLDATKPFSSPANFP